MGVVGETVEKVIAEHTCVVRDPASGTLRQIQQGQRVPPQLVEAYEAGEDLTGEDVEQVEQPQEDAAKVSGDLSRKTRGELEEIARAKGVEDPEDFGTKADLVEAIEAA